MCTGTQSLITEYIIKETKSTENNHGVDANFICEQEPLIRANSYKSDALTK